jgi:hypothetical protein
MQATQDRLLTYDEAMQRLGISRSALTSAISRGRFTPVKYPNHQRKYLRESEVIAYRSGPDTNTAPHPAPAPVTAANAAQRVTAPAPSNLPALAAGEMPPVFNAVLENIRQASRDTFTDTAAALVAAGMKMVGVTEDSDAPSVARFIETTRREMEGRMKLLLEAAAPVIVGMQNSITPDDITRLEDIFTGWLRNMSSDFGVTPELQHAGETLMQQVFAAQRTVLSRLPEYSIPALPPTEDE